MLEQPIVCPILVGRDEALDTVERCLNRARRGEGVTLLVGGEAGIGKSRLVAEARVKAQRLGFQTFQGHCFEPDRSLPFAPLIDLLQTHITRAREKDAEQSLADSAPALLQLLPDFAARHPGVTSSRPLDPERDRRRYRRCI